MAVRQDLKSMSPRKAAMRFLTLNPDERRANIREFFGASHVKAAADNGVTWQIDGVYDSSSNPPLQVSYTATPDVGGTFVTGVWVFLNNGIDENAPPLGCSATVLDGIQSAAQNAATGALWSTPQGPLAPSIKATLIAQLNNNEQSTATIQIPTTTGK